MGEGTETVALLEQYCEGVFELYNLLTQSAVTDGSGVRAILDEALQMVTESAERLAVKKEVVFMPYHASHWKAIESVWRATCADENCDVKVVPIPYYYKRRMGMELSEKRYDGEQFPEYVPITDFMK